RSRRPEGRRAQRNDERTYSAPTVITIPQGGADRQAEGGGQGIAPAQASSTQTASGVTVCEAIVSTQNRCTASRSCILYPAARSPPTVSTKSSPRVEKTAPAPRITGERCTAASTSFNWRAAG